MNDDIVKKAAEFIMQNKKGLHYLEQLPENIKSEIPIVINSVETLTDDRPKLPWGTDIIKKKKETPNGKISPLLQEWLNKHGKVIK